MIVYLLEGGSEWLSECMGPNIFDMSFVLWGLGSLLRQERFQHGVLALAGLVEVSCRRVIPLLRYHSSFSVSKRCEPRRVQQFSQQCSYETSRFNFPTRFRNTKLTTRI